MRVTITVGIVFQSPGTETHVTSTCPSDSHTPKEKKKRKKRKRKTLLESPSGQYLIKYTLDNFCDSLKCIPFHGWSNGKDSFCFFFTVSRCLTVPYLLKTVIVQNICFEASTKQKANYNLKTGNCSQDAAVTMLSHNSSRPTCYSMTRNAASTAQITLSSWLI
jgi:hypothetical protein